MALLTFAGLSAACGSSDGPAPSDGSSTEATPTDSDADQIIDSGVAAHDAMVGLDAFAVPDATVGVDASGDADATAGADASDVTDGNAIEEGDASVRDAGACVTSCDSELVMRTDGTLWHYTAAASTPTEIFGQDAGLPVISYADGYNASCAVLADHHVYCWTYPGVSSTYGDLGDGTDGGSTVPTLVVTSKDGPALSGIVQVFTDVHGGYASCALDANGAVWCWGQNTFSSLPDGGQTRSYAALPILQTSGGSQFSGAAKVAVGASHACAIKTDGTLWCWGATHLFVSPNYAYPFRMTALPAPVQDVAVDPDATCAVTADGHLWCWGYVVADGIATPDGGSDIPDNAPIEVTAQGVAVTDALQVEMPERGVCILRAPNRSIWCNGQITSAADLAPWPGALNDTTGVSFMGKGVGAPCYIDGQRQLAISGFSVTVPIACP
ncbi:MAG TPA: hypothetical protein VK762_03325 [Polyangiaceae bacterium]|nr:hypothetical protein [Polyangiaceae bacterium]